MSAEFSTRGTVLACPHCGGEYVHLDTVIARSAAGHVLTMVARGEDDRASLTVSTTLPPEHVLELAGTGRRYTFSIIGWCEECKESTVFEFRQHKGQSELLLGAGRHARP